MVKLTGRTHLTVDQNTTLADLKSFADKLKPGETVRAAKINGETVLYAKSGKSSDASKFFGVAKDRRERAQKSIERIVRTAVQQSTPSKAEANKGVVGTMNNLIDTLCGKSQSTPKGEVLKSLTNGLAFMQEGVTGSEMKKNNPNKLNSILDDALAVDTVVTKLANALTGKKENAKFDSSKILESTADDLANAISDLCRDDPKEIERFIRDDSAGLRRELGKAVMERVADTIGFHVGVSMLKKDHALIDNVVELASAKLLGLDSGSDQKFKLNGKEFDFVKDLNSGGFGKVALFKHPTEGEVAVKISLTTGNNKGAKGTNHSNTGPSEEYLRHKAALGDPPHPNVIGLKGAYTLQNGSTALVMEKATGDCSNLTENMHDKKNDISKESRKNMALTVVKDIGSAVGYCQKKGITHGDLKLENMFICDGGIVKLADFGTTQCNGQYKITDSSSVATADFLAPELNEVASKIEGKEASVTSSTNKTSASIQDDLKKVVPDDMHKQVEDSFKNALIGQTRDKLTADVEQIADNNKTGPKADTWHMGVMLFRMLTMKPIAESSFRSDLIDKIRSIPDGTPAVGPNSYFGVTTGDDAMDALINKMLVADPNKRPTMDVVLQDPLFSGKAVGSPETRNLLSSLGS